MSRVAQRKAALQKVADARARVTELLRDARAMPPVGVAAQVAHHRRLLAAYRGLAHALVDVSIFYRPESATQSFALGEHRALNIVIAGMQRELDTVAGDR